MRIQLHTLQLVYPPISNQEAEWLKEDKDVQKQLERSNLYFIGQKPESYFTFEEAESLSNKVLSEKQLPFNYHVGHKSSSGYFDIAKLLEFHGITEEQEIELEIGPKLIRFWSMGERDVIAWFTTEKFLYDRWTGRNYIVGFDDYQAFSIYHLHYVGISKTEDSLKRLVLKPHDKRLRILSNEHPLSRGSRVTDELILFFFEINSLELKQFLDNDFSEVGKHALEDKIKIVADAEKAFVKIMNTQYNEVKFNNYPISTDGLYDTFIERYSFSINENVSFITTDNIIRGKRNSMFLNEGYDFISIDKKDEIVELISIESLE